MKKILTSLALVGLVAVGTAAFAAEEAHNAAAPTLRAPTVTSVVPNDRPTVPRDIPSIRSPFGLVSEDTQPIGPCGPRAPTGPATTVSRRSPAATSHDEPS